MHDADLKDVIGDTSVVPEVRKVRRVPHAAGGHCARTTTANRSSATPRAAKFDEAKREQLTVTRRPLASGLPLYCVAGGENEHSSISSAAKRAREPKATPTGPFAGVRIAKRRRHRAHFLRIHQSSHAPRGRASTHRRQIKGNERKQKKALTHV
jgi:hypothetical protein